MSGSVTVSYLENCIFELCKLFEGGEKLFVSIDDWDDNGNDCGDDVDGDWDDDGNDVDEAHTDEQWGGAESKNGQSRCNYVDDEMLMVVVVPTFDDSDGDWCDDDDDQRVASCLIKLLISSLIKPPSALGSPKLGSAPALQSAVTTSLSS